MVIGGDRATSAEYTCDTLHPHHSEQCAQRGAVGWRDALCPYLIDIRSSGLGAQFDCSDA